jgi:hypothetical protein
MESRPVIQFFEEPQFLRIQVIGDETAYYLNKNDAIKLIHTIKTRAFRKKGELVLA